MSSKKPSVYKVIIADSQKIYCIGLETIIRKLAGVKAIYHFKNIEETNYFLKYENVDLILMNTRLHENRHHQIGKSFSVLFPKSKLIIYSASEQNKISNHEMMNLGAKAFFDSNASLEEIQKIIKRALDNETCIAPDNTGNFTMTALTAKEKNIGQANGQLKLKERHREVLYLLCKEYRTNEISKKLSLHEKTVEAYRGQLLELTRSKNIAGLIMYAVNNHLLDDSDLMSKFG